MLATEGRFSFLPGGAGSSGTPAEISQAHFEMVVDLVYRHCGIALADTKKMMVVSRLLKLSRNLGFDSLNSYLDHLESHQLQEKSIEQLLNAITTNRTSFFRHPEHFDFLEQWLAEEAKKIAHPSLPLRIWSAACSTGQEPYSIAMVANRVMQQNPDFKIRILASDVDTAVLKLASAARYPLSSLNEIPEIYSSSFHLDSGADGWEIPPRLRSMILFRQINLLKDRLRFKAPIDVIFCRNVLIYFNAPEQRLIVEKIRAHLRPGGLLFTGLAEASILPNSFFEAVGKNIHALRNRKSESKS